MQKQQLLWATEKQVGRIREAVICILNCSSNEELRKLRHQILEQVACEVVSPRPDEALAQIRSKKYDVLVICDPAVDQFIDSLCLEFRRMNSAGRVIAIQGARRVTAVCEADLVVDAYDPEALVEAIMSYPEVSCKFQHERRLTYSGAGSFLGWSCDRCCWNRPEPKPCPDRTAYVRRVEREFQAHSCEAYAREEWGPAA